jgi:ribonuclease P protein component
MPERLVNKADFERLLGTRSWARSAHFAVHHVPAAPQRPAKPGAKPENTELSTSPAPVCTQPVDDLPKGHWLGCVVPKRFARRAVTRNLLKRQVRGAFQRHGASLPAGLWLVRLRQPFDKATFISARSPALAMAARGELDSLLAGPAR